MAEWLSEQHHVLPSNPQRSHDGRWGLLGRTWCCSEGASILTMVLDEHFDQRGEHGVAPKGGIDVENSICEFAQYSNQNIPYSRVDIRFSEGCAVRGVSMSGH